VWEIMRKINNKGHRSRAGTEFQLVQIHRMLEQERVIDARS
jgi:hypothetical protein